MYNAQIPAGMNFDEYRNEYGQIPAGIMTQIPAGILTQIPAEEVISCEPNEYGQIPAGC